MTIDVEMKNGTINIINIMYKYDVSIYTVETAS